MRHLSIAIVTPALLLASLVLSDFAGAADVTPPPPGYRPPPSSYDFRTSTPAPALAHHTRLGSRLGLGPFPRNALLGRVT